MTLTLNESYLSTILYALAKCDHVPQARETLHELERQGVRIPVWIRRDVLAASMSLAKFAVVTYDDREYTVIGEWRGYLRLYDEFARVEVKARPQDVEAAECEGHPAGPFDPMGEDVYCDGTCRS